LIGWLPESMPVDVALEVVCQAGAKHAGKKYKYIPRDYINWLYYNSTIKHPVQAMAVEAIVLADD